MTPLLNQMSVVGLVSIPGMMTGQILGGSHPDQAARCVRNCALDEGISSKAAAGKSFYMGGGTTANLPDCSCVRAGDSTACLGQNCTWHLGQDCTWKHCCVAAQNNSHVGHAWE
jgi:hypothetical protein